MLAIIAVLALVAGWIVWPGNPGIHFTLGDNEVDVDFGAIEGRDLQGGLQVLLEANPPPGQSATRESVEAARSIIESRINEFGTTEPVIQIQGNNRIVVELPGIKSAEDRERAISLFGETGLLEFVDAASTPLRDGTKIKTVNGCTADNPPEAGTYCTILTGKNLVSKQVQVSFDQRNRPQINFGWDTEGARIFADYTGSHINQFMCIVLDQVVLSCPRIN